jgi:hypothetical protein
MDDQKAAVASAASGSQKAREIVDKAQQDPESYLGLTKEELEIRQKAARTSYKSTTKGTDRVLDVKSSSRAQQIMQKGVAEKQRVARQEDIKRKLALLRKSRWIFIAAGCAFLGYLSYNYFIPAYAMRVARRKNFEVRAQLAEEKLKDYMTTQEKSGHSNRLL